MEEGTQQLSSEVGQSSTEGWNLGCKYFIQGQVIYLSIRRCVEYLIREPPLSLSGTLPIRKEPKLLIALIVQLVPLRFPYKTTTI